MMIFYLLPFLVTTFACAFTDDLEFVAVSSDEDYSDTSPSIFESPREYEPLRWESFEWFHLVPGGEVLTKFTFSNNRNGLRKAVCFVISAVASRWQDFQGHEELLHCLGKELFNIRRVDGKIEFFNFVLSNVQGKDRAAAVLWNLIFRYLLFKAELEIGFVHYAYAMLEVGTNCVPIEPRSFPALVRYCRRNPEHFFILFPQITIESSSLLVQLNLDYNRLNQSKLKQSLQCVLSNKSQHFLSNILVAKVVRSLCLKFLNDEEVQLMAFYRGFSDFYSKPFWECSRCALLGPRRDSFIAALDRDFLVEHGPELVKIEPRIIDWLASAAVNNRTLSRTLYLAREFSFKHPKLVSVIFSNQCDFGQFPRRRRALLLAKFVIAAIGNPVGVAKICANADDRGFLQFASVFCNEHVFPADFEECALIVLQRAEQCKCKCLGKLRMEGKIAMNLFSPQILPRLLQLPVSLSIDLPVLLNAVRVDQFFMAIKENPQVLESVCFEQLELADLLLLPSKRVLELCEIHSAFCSPFQK